MVSDSDLARALRDRLGDDAVVDRETELAPYRTELRGRYRSRSAIAVLPRDTESVAAAVTLCAAHGVGIVPQGGNTGLCGGSVPTGTRREIVLSLGRLNRIRAVDALNDTLTAEAGCVLAEVQRAAEQADRLFALSLAAEGSYRNSGQRCTAVKRILVQEGIAADFTDRLVEKTKEYVCGDPMDEATRVGTVIDEASARSLEAVVQEAVAAGGGGAEQEVDG